MKTILEIMIWNWTTGSRLPVPGSTSAGKEKGRGALGEDTVPTSLSGTAHGRLMGLDVGEKRLGVALGDELGLTAQPYKTLERKNIQKDLERIQGLVEEYGVAAVVVGLPKNMDGTLGPQANRVSAFAGRIEKDLGIPVILWDERLSTVAVERLLLEADMSRAKRKKQVDKLAAAFILQGYLDSEGARTCRSKK